MVLRTFLLVAVLAVAGCGKGEDRPGTSGSASGSMSHAGEDSAPAFAKSEATTAVDLKAVDYSYVDLPATVKGPNVFFTVTNEGHTEHEFEVVGADGEPVGEIHEFAVGKTKTLALKLQPGTYTIQCLVKEGSKTHAELGMKSSLTVE